MTQKDITCKLLMEQFQKYPKMNIQDVFKFLYQSSFGCEHLVASEDAAIAYIRKEYEATEWNDEKKINPLDGAYSRVSLAVLKDGIRPETLGKLFCLSAKKEPEGIQALEQKLGAVKEMILDGTLPLSKSEYETTVADWKEKGYPAVHHSEDFRTCYHPSYRVISNRYISFLPLFAAIDRKMEEESAIVSIEGGSASGKSTLGEVLKEVYDCTLLHMDDFFLRPEQRTPKRFAEPGGNVDRERFLEEVLIPLSKNEVIQYRRFDCSTFEIQPAVEIRPKKLVIIEGAYSMHPELSQYYDLSVFLDISAEFQKKRIEKRNTPPFVKRFLEEWIPMEKKYFSVMQVKDRCDLLIPINETLLAE